MSTAEDYALVVGINDYKNPPYDPLYGAKQDATDFIAWLKDPAGGNVPDKNIDPFTKLSDASGSEPMLSHLLILLSQLCRLAPKGKKRIGRRLYLFLSGHGVSPRGEIDEAGLVTVDAQDRYNAFLPGKQSADRFSLAAHFDEVLLFMDCCRLTNLILDPFLIPIYKKQDADAARKVKRFYAFATGFGNTARETMHNGVTRGNFSRILLEGLKSAPTNAQGRRTTTQLRTYLETEMAKIEIDGEPLVPKFPALDEIVLAEGLAPKMSVVYLAFTQPTAGVEVLDGGNNFAPIQLVNVTATANGMRFTLPMGKGYVIRATDSARTSIMKTDQEEIYADL